MPRYYTADHKHACGWREPGGRDEHSTTVIGGEVYLWGGSRSGMSRDSRVHDSHRKRAILSIVEVFDVNTSSWNQRRTLGTPPLGQKDYACVAIKDNLYYFGGECGHGNCYHNSVHSLNTSTLQWRILTRTTSEQGAPMKKSGCGIVHFNDKADLLFIVGGFGFTPPPESHQCKAQYKQGLDGVYTNEQHIFSISTCK